MEHETFFHLDAPVWRVTGNFIRQGLNTEHGFLFFIFFYPGVDVPMPYTKSLEIAALPQIHDVVHAVNKVLGVK